jgi:two-component SAPR family response regulator
LKLIVLDERPPEGGVFRKLADLCASRQIKADSLEWFSTPSGLFSSFLPGENSLVFIRLDGVVNGLKAAQELKSMDRSVRFVFFSSCGSYALESYEFQPVDYLLEPVDTGRLGAVLIRAG